MQDSLSFFLSEVKWEISVGNAIWFPIIKFSMQSVIIDFGTNQHKFLTMMSESQSLTGLENFFFLYFSYFTTS